MDEIAVRQPVCAANHLPVLAGAVGAAGDRAERVTSGYGIGRVPFFHQHDVAAHHTVFVRHHFVIFVRHHFVIFVGHHLVILVRHHLVVLVGHHLALHHHRLVDGDLHKGGDIGIGVAVIHDPNCIVDVGNAHIGPGLSGRLFAANARFLIRLGAGVPQLQFSRYVLHAFHGHAVHIEEGYARLSRPDEKVVGLHEHGGKGEVGRVRRGLHLKLIGAARQGYTRPIGAGRGIEDACTEAHAVQGFSQCGRVAVLSQRLQAVSLIRFTFYEERTRLAVQYPDARRKRRRQVAVAGDVLNAHQEGNAFVHLVVPFVRQGSFSGKQDDRAREHQYRYENQ